jgi:uncharacterized repeat protein (TIGR01451 family)
VTAGWIKRIFHTDSTRGTFALAATLTLLVCMGMSVFSGPASAAVLSGTDHIGICHHDNGKPVYNFLSPNIHAIVVSPGGHAAHGDDIIPAFDYDLGKGAGPQHFPGLNTGSLAILANGCNPVAAVTPGALGTIASTCSGSPSVASAPAYTVPTGPTGVTYTPPAGGTATPGSTKSVTANAAPGYVLNLPGGGTGPSVVLTVVIPSLATCTNGGTLPVNGTAAAAENLGVSKTGTGSAQPGDELVWSLVVTNTQGTPATGFTVTDALPSGVSFSLAEGDHFDCSVAGGVISCTYRASLPVGQSATIAVRGLLDSTFTGTTVSNTAVVDPGRADSDPADNSSTAVTGVTPVPAPPGSTFTGGGGGATTNPPAKKPAAFTGGGGGAALPFTGSDSARLLQAGLSLLAVGLFLVLITRRRRAASE